MKLDTQHELLGIVQLKSVTQSIFVPVQLDEALRNLLEPLVVEAAGHHRPAHQFFQPRVLSVQKQVVSVVQLGLVVQVLEQTSPVIHIQELGPVANSEDGHCLRRLVHEGLLEEVSGV